MNDKTKQALELASEELQFFHMAGLARLQTLEAITAIKEAIALETVLLAEQQEMRTWLFVLTSTKPMNTQLHEPSKPNSRRRTHERRETEMATSPCKNTMG